MSLFPDALAEFVVGPQCPAQSELDEIAEQFEKSLEGLSVDPRSVAICRQRSSLGTNVVSIGVWSDVTQHTDEQLAEELSGIEILSDSTVALFLSTRAIQAIAERGWANVDKTQGRVTLDDRIDVRIDGDRIVTRVSGEYDLPTVLPSVDFTFTSRDRLFLAPSDSEFALQNDMSTHVDVGADILAIVVGVISPPLAGLIFFAADELASSAVPRIEGIGDAIAAQWPPHLLTAIRPPYLPGKFILNWTDLTVNEDGIQTQGTFTPANREPRVSIQGPTEVEVRQSLGHAQITYRLRITDLRTPQIQWGGAARGQDKTVRVLFRRPGTERITVSIRDADGLEASDELSVRVTVKPLEPGQHQR